MVDYTPASIRTITSDATYASVVRLAAAVRDGIALAISDGVNEKLRMFGDGMKSAVGGKGGYRSLATANQDIALAAQKSIVKSYDQVVSAVRSAPSGYRKGEIQKGGKNDGKLVRYSGGLLRNALSVDGLVVGTYNGFAIGNIGLLDAAAVHWARLNYGAGGAAGSGRPAAVVPITLFGATVSYITDPSGPRKGFNMPRGRFYETGEFFPNKRRAGEHQPIPTKGIAARRFFDAGLRSIAKEMPARYSDLLTQWTDQAVRQSRGPVKTYFE